MLGTVSTLLSRCTALFVTAAVVITSSVDSWQGRAEKQHSTVLMGMVCRFSKIIIDNQHRLECVCAERISIGLL